MLTIQQLLDVADKDSKIDRTNLESEILMVPKLQVRWLKRHWEYKKALIYSEGVFRNMVVDAQILYSGQATADKYKGHYRASIKAKNATEMGNLIDGDSKLVEYKINIDTAQEGCNICREVLESLKYRPNSLKTILDLRIFESGG